MAYLRICPLCQKRLPASARFCGRCGIHLDEALESFRAFAASASQTRVYTSPLSTAPVAKPTLAPPWPAQPPVASVVGGSFEQAFVPRRPARSARRPRSRVAPVLLTLVALLGVFVVTLHTTVGPPMVSAPPASTAVIPYPTEPAIRSTRARDVIPPQEYRSGWRADDEATVLPAPEAPRDVPERPDR